jgi:hypothetical protein
MLRAMLLMGVAEMSMIDAGHEFIDPSQKPEVAKLIGIAPTLLSIMRPVEQALLHAEIKAEGTEVPVEVRVPVSAQKLGKAIAAAAKADALYDAPCLPGVRLNAYSSPDRTLPTPTYIEHPPQYVQPLGGMLATAPPVPVPTVPFQPSSSLPSPYAGVPAQSVMPPAPSMPPPISSTWGGTVAQASSPVPVAPAPPAPFKLAVANVTKELALLFVEGDDGKLVFKQKVPEGEAVDVETTAGKRWVAVFAAEPPSGETWVAAPDKATWLLRPAARKEAPPEPTPRASTR